MYYVQQLHPHTSPSKMQGYVLAKITIRGHILYWDSLHHLYTYKRLQTASPMPSLTPNLKWEHQAHSHNHLGGVDFLDFSDGGLLDGTPKWLHLTNLLNRCC